MASQKLLIGPGKLLDSHGNLTQSGWSPYPVLDTNLEDSQFYAIRPLQSLRLKIWDYYAITTPTHFFSFTISDIGYLGMVFAYVIDFQTGAYKEETLAVPFAKGVMLPRNSTEGVTEYKKNKIVLRFSAEEAQRQLYVRWPGFANNALNAELTLSCPQNHESMNIVIPIPGKRYYYNRKINCMPAAGWVEYEGTRHGIEPSSCLANLDWGRGVWEYSSFWVWASASGFLPDGKRIGLNMGYGFGDTNAATENCFLLEDKVHKLEKLDFTYDNHKFKTPWTMKTPDGRLDLTFSPFFERVAKTDALVLKSEVHQMFGRYNGQVITDEGEKMEVVDLIGWAEEHNAYW